LPSLWKGNRAMILYLASYKTCAKRWNLDTKDIYLLSSFWEHKSGNCDSFVYQDRHILDSEAFSAFSGKNNNFDWDGYVRKYADFVYKNNIRLFFELDIDIVVGIDKVEYYREYLKDRTGRNPIPVWHSNRGKDYFVKMCEDYPYVAIGTTLATDEGRKIRKNPMILKWFIDQAHTAGSRIHGLGFTNTTYLKYLRFDSVDSTTWLSGARFGQIYSFDGEKMIYQDPPKGMRVKDHDLANRRNFSEWVKYQRYVERYL